MGARIPSSEGERQDPALIYHLQDEGRGAQIAM